MSIDRRSVLKSTAAAAVVGGPFAGLVAAPAEARRPPNAANLVPIPDLRDGEVRLHLPRGFQYRSFHDTESTVVLDDGTVLPGRHDGMGAFPGPNGNILLVRNHEVTNPEHPGVRARHAVRRGRGCRDDDHRGHEVRRGGARLHQPQRHDVQLQRRDHAVGVVDHLRGDGQRARRGARLPGLAQHRAAAEARLRLRGPEGRAEQPEADHPGGTLPPRGGLLRPPGRHPLPHRGQLRVPLRLLPLRPEAQPDEDRLPRQRGTAADARRPGRAERPPRGPAAEAGDLPRHLGRHRRSGPDVRTRHHERPGAGGGGGPGQGAGSGAVLPARGPGPRQRRHLLHLHPGGRAGRAGPGRAGRRRRQHHRLRQGQRPGLGLPLPLADAAGALPGPGGRRGGEPDLRLPRQHHHQQARDPGRLRGLPGRQLHPRPLARRPAVGHRAEPARQQPDRAAHGSETSSPDPRSAPTGTPSS